MAGWAAIAASAGWYLTGLAVTVALVVYPGFARVGRAEWAAYHRDHSSRITLAVAPVWLVEGVATVGWLVTAAVADRSAGPGSWTGPAELAAAAVHAVAAAATVALTVGAAVPAHAALGSGWQAASAARLRRAHSARTAAWAVAAAAATAGAVIPVLAAMSGRAGGSAG